MPLITLEISQIEEIAERAAARALRLYKQENVKGEWVSAKTACEMLEGVSPTTLHRRVIKGYIRKRGEKNEKKYYKKSDIEDYKAGKRIRYAP